MATLYELHRDRKKRTHPYTAREFNPYGRIAIAREEARDLTPEEVAEIWGE